MKARIFSVLAGLWLSGNAVAADRPVAREPWALELAASSPAVRHPSVVCTAPDGRVFVAEDPMDISAPANAPQGRIITFHPDGRRTIFATNLFAVFGMRYLEGKLYVLHNPRFTVFRDAGEVGAKPEDLIESTNPNPWALDWNDHVPANFRLAMDGYFYMAVGDKGIYGASGRDGRKVFLHGGGILRIRPDGTGMEVYSTGARNILDVALTSEDEIFTYDNTDEHDWMGRLTHMVDGGFYGYPHDFVPRRPYTLWMMHDFGGGAATGTFASTEDALPPEYHDNLFLADFGKRQIIRVVIARDGGTFKVVRHEELFSERPDHFRPVGIAPSHDGKSIYICDWQHRDTKENVEVGRLWKLTYTGKTFEKEKPAWFVPTALGRKCEARNEELIAALSHPSKNVRLTAQRELQRRPEAGKELKAAFPALASPATWHALWAMDAIGRESAQVVRSAAGKDASTHRQLLRWLGEHPTEGAPSVVIEGLRDKDASVRFQAATALGRLARPGLEQLMDSLAEPDHFTRFAIVTAINRICRANPASWSAVVQQLTHGNPALRERITYVFRETYDFALAQRLMALAQDRNAPRHARETALASLAAIMRRFPEWKGEWWAYHPALAPAPVRTIAWEATEPALDLFAKILEDEPALRSAALRSIAAAHESTLAPNVRDLFTQDQRAEIKVAVLRTLGALKYTNASPVVAKALAGSSPEMLRAAMSAARHSASPAVRGRLMAIVSNESLAPDLRAESIATLSGLHAVEALPAVAGAAKSKELEIRFAAIDALGNLGGPIASKALLPLLDRADSPTRIKTVQALGRMKDTNAVPKLLAAYTRGDTRDAALEALLRMPHLSAVEVYIEALGNRNPATRERARQALEPFRDQAWPGIRARLPTMRPAEIAEIQKLYPEQRDLTLLTRDKVIPSTADYLEHGLKNKGNAQNGQRLFHDPSGVACIKCHTVAGAGNAVGPDMTTIGAQFPRVALIEHILDPGKSVREGYAQALIETSDDESFAGLIKHESAEAVTILDAQARLHTIPKSKITARRNSELSLMPAGLHLGLSLEEFADLLAYLESLKTDPRKPPQP